MAPLPHATTLAYMFENIAVAYAGDQAGTDAVALAVKLADVLASKLSIVFPYHPLLAAVPGDAAQQQVRDELKAIAPDSPSLKDATYLPSHSQWPIRATHEIADYQRCDLIVFGAAREGIAEHLHISLMERMVHAAPCAVLVAPSGYAQGAHSAPRHVGVGFASSKEGKQALQLGRELAQTFDGDLRVIAASWLSLVVRGYAAQAASISTLESETFAETKASLEEAVVDLGDIHVDAQVIKGDPITVLLEHSKTLDLLVLGSRAYGPVRHALLGSVSAAVMREADCPVLVTPRSG
jgi:nucleotide-binding universal stress UspA family protein